MKQTLHIKIEGPAASGKSTFMHKLMDTLVKQGYEIKRTNEPHTLVVSWTWESNPY